MPANVPSKCAQIAVKKFPKKFLHLKNETQAKIEANTKVNTKVNTEVNSEVKRSEH